MVIPGIDNWHLILGSGSPRRAMLLTELGLKFSVKSFDVDESFPSGMPPAEVAEYLARKKADTYKSQLAENELLITADTLVSANGEILNKPQNSQEAFDMIWSLSGKNHEVISGVALTSSQKQQVFHCTTKVEFDNLTEEEIKYYVEKYKPFDKAGAYGIQEWIGYVGVRKIDGNFNNVVGLPTHLIFKNLKDFIVK